MGKWSHNKLVVASIKNREPKEIYAELLWEQQTKGFKPGWVAMKFREIFGGWPAPRSMVSPKVPSTELREYLGIMKNRWKQKKKREEAKQGVALVNAFRSAERFQFSGDGLDPAG